MQLRRDSSKVIIFDWDDTICPSSFVDKCSINSYRDLPLHVSAEDCIQIEFCLV